MTGHKQPQPLNSTNTQLNQLFRLLSQISRNSSENTGLVIAYLSLLGFFATGIFGILALLISQRSYINLPQAENIPSINRLK